MHESRDFRLLKDDSIKTQLRKLNNRCHLIDVLQSNYLHGLDTEFMPLWVRNVDMIGFAFNETQCF